MSLLELLCQEMATSEVEGQQWRKRSSEWDKGWKGKQQKRREQWSQRRARNDADVETEWYPEEGEEKEDDEEDVQLPTEVENEEDDVGMATCRLSKKIVFGLDEE